MFLLTIILVCNFLEIVSAGRGELIAVCHVSWLIRRNGALIDAIDCFGYLALELIDIISAVAIGITVIS